MPHLDIPLLVRLDERIVHSLDRTHYWLGILYCRSLPAVPGRIEVRIHSYAYSNRVNVPQPRISYLSDCYPRYVASVLAGNDFFRSIVGAAFPLFSTGTRPPLISFMKHVADQRP